MKIAVDLQTCNKNNLLWLTESTASRIYLYAKYLTEIAPIQNFLVLTLGPWQHKNFSHNLSYFLLLFSMAFETQACAAATLVRGRRKIRSQEPSAKLPPMLTRSGYLHPLLPHAQHSACVCGHDGTHVKGQGTAHAHLPAVAPQSVADLRAAFSAGRVDVWDAATYTRFGGQKLHGVIGACAGKYVQHTSGQSSLCATTLPNIGPALKRSMSTAASSAAAHCA